MQGSAHFEASATSAAAAPPCSGISSPSPRAPATNAFGQPIGPPAGAPATAPTRATARRLPGRWCSLEPLDAAAHGGSLFRAWSLAPDDRGWTYLWAERPATPAACAALLASYAATDDPLHFAVVLPCGAAAGTLSLMRVDARSGCAEVGHVNFASPLLARGTAATEAVYLLLRAAFEGGFRRLEWKCDALNAGSVRAAARYGFTPEGVFREHFAYKGRLRDTAWFSLLRGAWEGAGGARAALEAWLRPANFDASGAQREPLAAVAARLKAAAGAEAAGAAAALRAGGGAFEQDV